MSDNWDDYHFKTLFLLFVFDSAGVSKEIGAVKFGNFQMQEDHGSPGVPETFNSLGEEFFSLGQDDAYYVNLSKLGEDIREEVLRSLRDVARDLDLFNRAHMKRVLTVSLMRGINDFTVRGQFHRLATGGARLSEFNFRYLSPTFAIEDAVPVELAFHVVPESHPPTNVHVLIGRNGVGKTTLMNAMSRALADSQATSNDVGSFEDIATGGLLDEAIFANLVSVSFSAFDAFPPLAINNIDKIKYSYIGLKQERNGPRSTRIIEPKTPDEFAEDFAQSVLLCQQGARALRWKKALTTLEADPIFQHSDITRLASSLVESDGLQQAEIKEEARQLFHSLSSGHKIVLLTMTQLVGVVDEKTLVLMDEPEAHLHPPLLSAFVRALSDLLIDRNGVAVIATHSPVILQEVPRSCVWKIHRSGSIIRGERPETETFGENIGILTREVFRLEVTESGFHKILSEELKKSPDYDEVIARFNGELGNEAKAILSTLIAQIRARTLE